MAARWTQEEDELLKSIYVNSTKASIIETIKKPWFTIHRRALRLKLKRNIALINEDKKKRGPRKDAWTKEEEKLLTEIYRDGSKKEITAKIDRPWKGIWHRAYELGLRRNREIIIQEMIEGGINAPPNPDTWTEEQLSTLKTIYENSSKDDILSRIAKSWVAIRTKAISLGMRRDPILIQKDTTKNAMAGMLKNHGVMYSTQLESMKEKSRATNMAKLGVPYPTQSKIVRDKAKASIQVKYGVNNVFQNSEVKEKIRQTNIERYGVENPLQNPDILKKVQATTKENNSFSLSDEEIAFFDYLRELDPFVEHQVTHPQVRCIIDYFSPKFNVWIQYDGDYWHGRNPINKSTPRTEHIIGTMQRDEEQNVQIPNLVRFWDSDVQKAIEAGTIRDVILQKILGKAKLSNECYQYRKKVEFLGEDIESLGIDAAAIKASDFTLSHEKLSPEIVFFIKRYEWLGNIGVTPRWCFTARYNNLLGGVVLVNEPTSYSKLLGDDTPVYEALIQRGATASWTPKNLGSRLVSFSCRWMVENTKKRLFVGYADPKAHEIGTIYQACNFDYIGDNFGSAFLYRNPAIKNGNTFSAQSLKRTSSFRRWCKENSVPFQSIWIKSNGFKDLSSIPVDVKNRWYCWIKDTIANSTKILTEKKRKYALIMATDKKEKRELLSKKSYTTYPYPKRGDSSEVCAQGTFEGYEINPVLSMVPATPRKYISTKSRVTPEKIEYIINNFNTKTVRHISEDLKETMRWVQSQVKKLIKEGRLQPKNPAGSTDSRETKSKTDFIINNWGKKSTAQIALELGETKRWVKRQLYKLSLNKKQ